MLEVKNPVSSYTSIALLKIKSQRDLPNIFPPFFILLLLKRPRKRQNTKILKSCSFDFCRHQTSFIVDLLTITLAHQLINFNNFQTYILTSGETSLSCSSSCYKWNHFLMQTFDTYDWSREQSLNWWDATMRQKVKKIQYKVGWRKWFLKKSRELSKKNLANSDIVTFRQFSSFLFADFVSFWSYFGAPQSFATSRHSNNIT